MKLTIRIAALVGLLLMVLTACGAGPHSVTGAKVTDYITNVEQKKNGYAMLFVQTDTTSVYCTKNAAIIELAEYLRESHTMATITYSTINAGDADGNTTIVVDLGNGCDAERVGITTYRLEAICKSGFEVDVPCVPESARPRASKYHIAQ